LSSDQSAQEQAPKAEDIIRLAGALALENKALNVVCLDLREFPLNTDFFLIASGLTERHVRAMADEIADGIDARLGARPWHLEGRAHGRWILLDYVDCVVHLFHRETRDYYMLERLWGDAPRELIGDGTEASVADEAAEEQAESEPEPDSAD